MVEYLRYALPFVIGGAFWLLLIFCGEDEHAETEKAGQDAVKGDF